MVILNEKKQKQTPVFFKVIACHRYLFCLSLIVLSKELNQTRYGYNMQKRSLNHQCYMDDLKLFSKDDKDLEGLLQTVKKFSDGIDVSFGLDKCAKANFERGTLRGTTSLGLDQNTVIQDLVQEKV